MNRISCEICGSNDLLKQDGVFVCQNCGSKYPPDIVSRATAPIRSAVEAESTEIRTKIAEEVQKEAVENETAAKVACGEIRDGKGTVSITFSELKGNGKYNSFQCVKDLLEEGHDNVAYYNSLKDNIAENIKKNLSTNQRAFFNQHLDYYIRGLCFVLKIEDDVDYKGLHTKFHGSATYIVGNLFIYNNYTFKANKILTKSVIQHGNLIC